MEAIDASEQTENSATGLTQAIARTEGERCQSYGRSPRTAMVLLLWSSALAVRGPLADAKNNELGGFQRRHPDQADKTAVVQIVLAHG